MKAGCLLRSSSWPANQSPFLLSNQEFHKAIILVTRVEKNFTVGVLLNRPEPEFTKWIIPLSDSAVKIPVRYGGRFGVKGDSEKPTFWFHHSHSARLAGIRRPLGRHDGIWSCNLDEACQAIKSGLAAPDDFLVANGCNIWPEGLTIGTWHVRMV